MDQGSKTLLELLERADIPHSLHKVIPFIGELEPDITPKGPVIVIGSYSMRHVARAKGWWPGSFDLADITTADCIEHWGQHMLNADAVTCSFGDALAVVAMHDLSFIRPTVDSKFFAGGVFSQEEFAEWWTKVVILEEDNGSTLTKDTEVIVASTKPIQAEYRTWVIDGKVVTASLYKRGGRVVYQECIDQEIIDFAQARAVEWQPRRAFVLDVARIEAGLRIVEINTLNAAGFYAANVASIVDALEKMAESEDA